MRPKEPRIAPLSEAEWSEEVREILEPARQQGRLLNIFTTLAHHPKLFRRWMTFGGQLLFKSTLPPREREMLILRISWLTRGEYEWSHHVLLGKQAGLSDEEIARIREGPMAQGWTIFDAVLLRSVDEMHRNNFISEQTWKILSTRYDNQQMIDLLFTIGHYHLLAGVLNSLGVQLDDGVDGFPQ
ncbi:MAG: carboxymuconolactone decarboxylase family protein [Acidobacteriota bacterium]